MSLIVDYRPRDLDSVAGNEAAIKSLETIMEDLDKANHVFLFTGSGGCGKSTLARILAQELGAYDPDKSSNPSFQEINTSDLRGIDTVRDVIKVCRTSPMFATRRVFFFDECHQISGDAQEAFLHLLENSNKTPNWFLFATTEPDKLKETFKRRCTIFELKPLTKGEMDSYLRDICTKAKIKVSGKTLAQIVAQANGSCGIALAMLDKVKDVSEEDASILLTMSDDFKAKIIDLCRGIAKKEGWSKVSGVLDSLRDEQPEKVRRAIMAYAANWMIKKEHPRAFLILDAFREPTYDSGFAQLVYASYMVLHA